MLDLFFTTAEILVFLKVFLIHFDSNKTAVASTEIVSICFLCSSKDPGNIYTAQSFSILFLGKESSWTYREYFVLTLKLSTDNLFLHCF